MCGPALGLMVCRAAATALQAEIEDDILPVVYGDEDVLDVPVGVDVDFDELWWVPTEEIANELIGVFAFPTSLLLSFGRAEHVDERMGYCDVLCVRVQGYYEREEGFFFCMSSFSLLSFSRHLSVC